MGKIINSLKTIKNIRIIKKSGQFDNQFYLSNYLDVRESTIDPLVHYIKHGWREGRNPSSEFDTNYYLESYPDVKISNMNPLVHYIKLGQSEGRIKSKAEYQEMLLKNTELNEVIENRKANTNKVRNREEIDNLFKKYELLKNNYKLILKYWENKEKNNKIVVYTALIGDYDILKIPEKLEDNIDYICFSNNNFNGLIPWQIRPLNYYNDDPTRVANYYKLHPHLLFPEYETVIWIDANILIKRDCNLLDYVFDHKKWRKIISTFKNPYRNCIIDEVDKCISFGKDDKNSLTKQAVHYINHGLPKNFGLADTKVVISCPGDKEVKKFYIDWWHELESWSKMDQVSLPYVLYKNNKEFNPLFEDDYNIRDDGVIFQYYHHNNDPEKKIHYNFPLHPHENMRSCKLYPMRRFLHQENSVNHNDYELVLHLTHNDTNSFQRISKILKKTRNIYEVKIIFDERLICREKMKKEIKKYINNSKYNVDLYTYTSYLIYKSLIKEIAKNSSKKLLVYITSSAEVPKNWLNKIIKCSESTSSVGLVSPLSNYKNWGMKNLVCSYNEKDIESINKICNSYDVIDYPVVSMIEKLCFAVDLTIFRDMEVDDNLKVENEEESFWELIKYIQNQSFKQLIATDLFILDHNPDYTAFKHSKLKNQFDSKRIEIELSSMRKNSYLKFLNRRLIGNKDNKVVTIGFIVTISNHVYINSTSYIRIFMILKRLFEEKNINYFIITNDRIKYNPNNCFWVSDYIVTLRDAISPDTVDLVIQNSKKYKIPIIYDIDDNLFTKIPNFSVSNEAKKSILKLANNSGFITTSTRTLFDLMKNKVKKVPIEVRKNFLDKDLWLNNNVYKPKIKTNDKIKILYMGTRSHYEDLKMIEPAVEKVLNEYDNVEFYTIAGTQKELTWLKPVHYRHNSYIDFVEWFTKFTEEFDFAICPLINNSFNKYKSYIKYLDYSACGLPAIYSDHHIYKEVITHNKNGLLAQNNIDAWYKNIKYLVENKEVRDRIGQYAFKDVINNHLISKNIIENFYKILMTLDK